MYVQYIPIIQAKKYLYLISNMDTWMYMKRYRNPCDSINDISAKNRFIGVKMAIDLQPGICLHCLAIHGIE